MGWRCWIIYRSPRFKKDHQTPNLRAVSCNWIIHYMWQLFPLEADWEINNQGIKSRTVQPLFLFPLWPITSPQFKHLQCHSSLWHFLARSHVRARVSARAHARTRFVAETDDKRKLPVEKKKLEERFYVPNVDLLDRELFHWSVTSNPGVTEGSASLSGWDVLAGPGVINYAPVCSSRRYPPMTRAAD